MRGKKTVTGLIITFISLLIIASIVYYSRLFVPNTLKAGNYSTETVQRGQVVSATIATGVVEPENEVLVLSPAAGIIQTIVAEPGNRVKKNDIILQLNTEGINDQIEKLKNQLEVSSNNLQRTRLNAQSTRLDLDYNEEVKKLRITSLESQLADQEELLEVGGISPARIEQTRQEITLATKDLEMLVEKNSIRLEQLEAEEHGILLQIRMQEKELEELEKLVQKMTIRAPSSGIILSVSGNVGERVGRDDLLVRMSDLTSFKISGSVDEQHAKQLKTGNSVFVNIDDEQLEGTVGNITPLVENNKVQFNIHLQESSHPKLIANQQVQLQIINNLKENTLRITKQPELEYNKTQKVFVIEGDRAVKKDITIGIIGNDYCEILDGLKEGDVIITEGTNAIRHLEEILIEY
ncbi:MAG: HlyD family efflux transporter periplasmic adaptor subunit [Prolixibacteraceae bacterium]|nr:HlyD family efflux transporter periplasmic adaptor subunit [Prolixibacteraceae bacterium]